MLTSLVLTWGKVQRQSRIPFVFLLCHELSSDVGDLIVGQSTESRNGGLSDEVLPHMLKGRPAYLVMTLFSRVSPPTPPPAKRATYRTSKIYQRRMSLLVKF